MNADDRQTKDNSLKLKTGLVRSIKSTIQELKIELNDIQISFKQIHKPEFKEDLTRLIKSISHLRSLVINYNKKCKK